MYVFVSRCAVCARREHEPYFVRYPLIVLSWLSPTLPQSPSDQSSSVPAHPVRPACLVTLIRALTFFSRSSERERYILRLSLITHSLTLLQVLLYLEGLRESQTIDSPNSSGFPNLPLPSSKLSALDNDQDFDDINSNVQDGRKTELSIGRHSALVGIPFSSLLSAFPRVQPHPIARTWSARSAGPSLRVF